MLKHTFNQKILRKYDIRGTVGVDLHPQDAYALGFAFVNYLMLKDLEPTIVVTKDARQNGIELKVNVIKGIIDAGGKAIDCGIGPTPMCYFASYHLKSSGFMAVTGSHNPINHNGFKFGIAGKAFTEDDIIKVADIAQHGCTPQDGGIKTNVDIVKDYITRLLQGYTKPKGLKFGFNALNGSAGIILPELCKQINAPIFECEMNPDLKTVLDPSNQTNIERIQNDLQKNNLDIIFAFDGDADRIMAITAKKVLYGEDILLLCAKEVLAKEKGKVIFDVKCSATLPEEILEHGGLPIMYKTGHSLIKQKMLEENAILAGECSGHIYFKQGYYGFDDGIYTSIRLLSYFSQHPLIEELNKFKHTFKSTEIKIPCEDKFTTIAKLKDLMKSKGLQFNDIDGVRANYEDSSWFLIRASNTEEVLIIRYESRLKSGFEKTKKFTEELLSAIK